MRDIRVLFVCLGNICRSPSAEGVFRKKVEDRGLAKTISIDSAGTSDWHIGKSPDTRTIKAASERGYSLASLRGRQAIAEDFEHFDYILAMDSANLANLEDIQPADSRAKLSLFLEYSQQQDYSDVPDPYYGGDKGFELVLDLIEDASEGLLEQIEKDFG